VDNNPYGESQMNSNRLLVFDTIGEACRLWAAHLRLVCIIALAVSIPEVLQIVIRQIGGNAWWAQITGKALLGVFLFILDAVKSAVLLTAIVNGGQLPKKKLLESINRFGSKLVGVHLLIAILGGVAVAFVSFCVAAFHLFEVPTLVTLLSVAMAVMWIIFLKYALTDPLVVIENYNVVDALRQSWRMTRNHLGYVAANYIAIGATFALIGVAGQHFIPNGWLGVLSSEIILLVVDGLGLIWVTLALCMYHRIKAADAH
jgi:hypothetical protein